MVKKMLIEIENELLHDIIKSHVFEIVCSELSTIEKTEELNRLETVCKYNNYEIDLQSIIEEAKESIIDE